VSRIVSVVGARPNFMKVAPLYEEIKSRGGKQILVHTGQHYDENMSKIFFEDLSMPKPDIYYGIGSGSHASQTAKVMLEFEKTLSEINPALVIVVGDVNSTLACALVCAKMRIPIAHVESGLRSFDMDMPEEVNRILTDSISDFLLTPSIDANENLLKEGIKQEKIHFVGNIMIDSLYRSLKKSRESTILKYFNLESADFGLLTLHRPSNVDDQKSLLHLVESACMASQMAPMIFPVHPRTRKLLISNSMEKLIQGANLTLCNPLGYLDFINLLSHSKFVLTDSGGIQEETTALGIPCLTLRENTERPITVSTGTNTIVGKDRELILTKVSDIMGGSGKKGKIPKFWDGKTASRISDVIQFAIS